MRGVWRWARAAALVAACGGSPPPRASGTWTRARDVDATLTALAYRPTDGWFEAAGTPAGTTYGVPVPARTCAAVVALADGPGSREIRMTVAGMSAPTAPGASWIVACVDEANVLDVTVFSKPEGRILFAAYLGTANEASARLRAVLNGAAPPAPPAPIAAAQPAADEANAAEANASPAAPTDAEPATAAGSSPAEGAEAAPRSADVFDLRQGTPDAAPPPDSLVSAVCEASGDEARPAARAHYQAAHHALDQGDLDVAAEQMEHAYACHPDGTILLNLAGIRARQRKFAVAQRLYQQLLARYPNMPERRRRQVEEALDRLAHGTVRVRVHSGDRVYINGVEVPVRRRRAQVRLTVGRAEVRVVDREGNRWQTYVEVAPTQTRDVDPRAEAEGP